MKSTLTVYPVGKKEKEERRLSYEIDHLSA